ncbi:MAG: glutamyl-tRNA synthetase [Thermoleophilaceae bacterium]|jgi:glutamyl-tRNA synthetase|nr:glutamyl-tRNA synthetase [Thermoleophilaceae bacterium]
MDLSPTVPSGHTGRFAPSPSGPFHEGNLRTALVAWMRARAQGARFLLRIEDLDPQRSKPEHEASQIADLRAIGIDWDEEPVRQSERHDLYAEALAELERLGRVYPCWCTRAEIREAAQAPHGPLPEGAYPGTCRELTAEQRADHERTAGRPPALRLDAQSEPVSFTDVLHGPLTTTVDDIVLRRHDGAYAYNLAVIVDDADQEIGEVVRGDDLLDTTPRQLLIARLLSLAEPAYAHVPLVLDDEGRRLAKRDASELPVKEGLMDEARQIAQRLEAAGGQSDD